MFSCTLLLLAATSLLLVAQQSGGSRQSRGQYRYNPATEVTVTGTVEEVQEHAHPGLARLGLHLTVKAAEGKFDVHLGPASFVKKEGMTLAKGDVITVTGSKIPYEGAEAVLAREVKKGEKTLVLRNAKGIPLWSGGRRKS